MDQLRTAGVVLRRDLQAKHFSPDPQPGNPSERTRLSDYRFDLTGTSAPRGGFFRIYSPASTPEGVDADNLVSYRAENHQLHFTSVLPGGKDEELYFATITRTLPGPPPTITAVAYSSQAAEIAYFLVADTGQFTNGPGTQQLYKLIRRQRLVAYTDADRQALNMALTDEPATASDVISIRSGNLVNAMPDLTNPANRLSLGVLTTFTPINRVGDDILLSNVISFEVKVLWIPTGSTTPGATAFASNTDYPFDNLLALPGNTFDTGSNPAPTIRVKALQIRLRVFDGKLKAARQNTFVVEM